MFFITGTGTDVGKTIATAAIASYLAPWRSVHIVKPFQTGTSDLSHTDAETITKLSGIAASEWYHYDLPLAPWTAAQIAHQRLPSVAEVARRLASWFQPEAIHLVEGAGGVLVTLGQNAFNLLDLADHTAQLGMTSTFVVVVDAGLGALNTAMLTVNAISAAGHSIAGLVIGSWPSEPGLAERTNVSDFTTLTSLPVLASIPQGAGTLTPKVFANLAPTWFTDQARELLLQTRGVDS